VNVVAPKTPSPAKQLTAKTPNTTTQRRNIEVPPLEKNKTRKTSKKQLYAAPSSRKTIARATYSRTSEQRSDSDFPLLGIPPFSIVVMRSKPGHRWPLRDKDP
jgi:hypothetical protein